MALNEATCSTIMIVGWRQGASVLSPMLTLGSSMEVDLESYFDPCARPHFA